MVCGAKDCGFKSHYSPEQFENRNNCIHYVLLLGIQLHLSFLVPFFPTQTMFFGFIFSWSYILTITILILFLIILSVFFNKNFNDLRYLNSLILFYFCATPLPWTETVFRLEQKLNLNLGQNFFVWIQNAPIFYNVFVFYIIINLIFFYAILTDRFYIEKVLDLEFSLLILFLFLGALFLMWVHTCIDFLIAIEILTLGGYTLIAYNRKNFFSTYAGVQYFILGAIPSAFLLLGFIFLYKTWGTLFFENFDLVQTT